MRILFLTQIVPYPPDAGPRIKTWNVLRYLANCGHSITLATFIREDEREHLAPLLEICSNVFTVPIHRSRISDIGYFLRSLISGRPFLLERDDMKGMRSLVSRLLKNEEFDYIHADQLTMTQFALQTLTTSNNAQVQNLNVSYRNGSLDVNRAQILTNKERPVLVFDAHNAVWTIVERMRERMPFYTHPLLNIEARRVKAFEGMIVQKFDHTLAVSEIDRQDLLKALDAYVRSSLSIKETISASSDSDKGQITVIPIAVDTIRLRPITRRQDSFNILTLGTLQYPPNVDGIRWFVGEVFPLIYQQIATATLTIIGKNPPQDILRLEAKDPTRIKVTGYVDDLVPYFEETAVIVVPVNAGSGMRVRILEAFARAMPVVTTSVGLEGIEAELGEDVLVADSPDDFAKAVVRLLQDEDLRDQLANNGRHLAETLYDWRVSLRKLNHIYENDERII